MTEITSIAANIETVRGREKTVKKRITPALTNVETVGRESGNCCPFSKNTSIIVVLRIENREQRKRETQTHTKGFQRGRFCVDNDRMDEAAECCIWGLVSLADLLNLLHSGFNSSPFLCFHINFKSFRGMVVFFFF